MISSLQDWYGNSLNIEILKHLQINDIVRIDTEIISNSLSSFRWVIIEQLPEGTDNKYYGKIEDPHNPPSIYECDVCNDRIYEGSEHFQCKSCDYDIHLKCILDTYKCTNNHDLKNMKILDELLNNGDIIAFTYDKIREIDWSDNTNNLVEKYILETPDE